MTVTVQTVCVCDKARHKSTNSEENEKTIIYKIYQRKTIVFKISTNVPF